MKILTCFANGPSTKKHLFNCAVLKRFIPELENNKIKYEFIFGNMKQMKEVVQILIKISDIRQQLLDDIK